MARSMRLARDMYIVLLLHLAWALMAVPVVTRQQRVPASAATWLALILLLPVAGTLLYILAAATAPRRIAPPAAATASNRSSPTDAAHARPGTTASGCSTTATTPSRH